MPLGGTAYRYSISSIYRLSSPSAVRRLGGNRAPLGGATRSGARRRGSDREPTRAAPVAMTRQRTGTGRIGCPGVDRQKTPSAVRTAPQAHPDASRPSGKPSRHEPARLQPAPPHRRPLRLLGRASDRESACRVPLRARRGARCRPRGLPSRAWAHGTVPGRPALGWTATLLIRARAFSMTAWETISPSTKRPFFWMFPLRHWTGSWRAMPRSRRAWPGRWKSLAGLPRLAGCAAKRTTTAPKRARAALRGRLWIAGRNRFRTRLRGS